MPSPSPHTSPLNTPYHKLPPMITQPQYSAIKELPINYGSLLHKQIKTPAPVYHPGKNAHDAPSPVHLEPEPWKQLKSEPGFVAGPAHAHSSYEPSYSYKEPEYEEEEEAECQCTCKRGNKYLKVNNVGHKKK